MQANGRAMLLGVGLSACASTLTPAEIFEQGKPADAIKLVCADSGDSNGRDYRREAECRRLRALYRQTRHGRVHARVVPADEIARLTGAKPSAAYGDSIFVIEARIDPSARGEYTLDGSIGLENPTADGDEDAVGHWNELIDTPQLRSAENTAAVLKRLWTLPPAPQWKCTPGNGEVLVGENLLGMFLLLTGVTPSISIMSGSDQVTPMLQPHVLPGTIPGKCDPPTPEELTAWAREPTVVASRMLDKMLLDGSAGRDPSKVVSLQHWEETNNPRGHKGFFAQKSMVLGISLKLMNQAGQPTEAGGWLRVPLLLGSTVPEQIALTFGTDGVDMAPLVEPPPAH